MAGLRTAMRRRTAATLRTVADWLRTEDVQGDDLSWDVGAANDAATAASEDTMPAHLRGHAAAAAEREASQEAEDDALLMAGAGMLSGNLEPAVTARQQDEDQGEVIPHRARTAPAATDPALAAVEEAIVEQLQTIFDPEIPVDIYQLGLIYTVDVNAEQHVDVKMTLTSPNCPAAQSLPAEVKVKVDEVAGVTGSEVEVVFDPPWSPEMMSEEARLELNL